MKSRKINKKFLIAGMMMVGLTNVIAHYLKPSDLVFGCLIGISIGCLALSIILPNIGKPSH